MWSPEREAEAPAGGDPAGLLPPEWEEDEERMSFLFSAFKRFHFWRIYTGISYAEENL